MLPRSSGSVPTTVTSWRVGRGIKAEGDLVAHRHGERNVVAPATETIALIPAFVDGDLELVAAGRQVAGREGRRRRRRRCPAARQRRQSGCQSPGQPSAALVTARRGGDAGPLVVGDPVGLVVVVELDGGGLTQSEPDIVAARGGIAAVVLVPRVVERDLVFPVAGRQFGRKGPEIECGVVAQFGGRTLGLPVARTTEFALQRADHGDASRIGGVIVCRRGQRWRWRRDRAQQRCEQSEHEREVENGMASVSEHRWSPSVDKQAALQPGGENADGTRIGLIGRINADKTAQIRLFPPGNPLGPVQSAFHLPGLSDKLIDHYFGHAVRDWKREKMRHRYARLIGEQGASAETKRIERHCGSTLGAIGCSHGITREYTPGLASLSKNQPIRTGQQGASQHWGQFTIPSGRFAPNVR